MISFLKVLGVLLLLVILIARRWNIGLIMLAAAFVLSLLFSMGIGSWIVVAGKAMIKPDTLSLLAALLLIQLLEATLRRTGLLQQMVDSLKKMVVDHRIVTIFLPAFLGFLPSAGGARFSAPLVAEASKDLNLSGERKAFINYWFRHVMEPIVPIYPGLIMAAGLLMISVPQLVSRTWPFTIAMILVGLPLAFAGVAYRGAGTQEKMSGSRDWLRLLSALLPVALIMVLVLAFQVDLVISLASAFLFTLVWAILGFRWRGRELSRVGKELLSKSTLNIVFLVLGVFVFKDTLQASGAVEALTAFFQSAHVPDLLLVALLPFLIGFLTGLTPGFVGVAFPLLLVIFGNPPNLSVVALAYAGGLAGILLSPVHLCLVLTKEYFQADWLKLYRMLLPASLAILLVATLLFWVW